MASDQEANDVDEHISLAELSRQVLAASSNGKGGKATELNEAWRQDREMQSAIAEKGKGKNKGKGKVIRSDSDSESTVNSRDSTVSAASLRSWRRVPPGARPLNDAQLDKRVCRKL
jgi:hypothetical protein